MSCSPHPNYYLISVIMVSPALALSNSVTEYKTIKWPIAERFKTKFYTLSASHLLLALG